jgi:hypothetical protein
VAAFVRLQQRDVAVARGRFSGKGATRDCFSIDERQFQPSFAGRSTELRRGSLTAMMC